MRLKISEVEVAPHQSQWHPFPPKLTSLLPNGSIPHISRSFALTRLPFCLFVCDCVVVGCVDGSVVSGVGWTPCNDLYLVSDDRRVRRWSLSAGQGEVGLSCVVEVEYYVTGMRWLNSVKGGQLSADCLALACSDGAVRLMSANGRVERVIASAHVGSVLCVEWSADGASLLTGGEDGLVKQWSRSGHLRSKLAAVSAPVTSLAWSPDGEKFAFTSGRNIAIQFTATNGTAASSNTTASTSSSSSSSASRQWTAHTGAVLCCDWHPMTGQLLTGGEDGVYRLWTEEGELVFASRPFDFPVSAVKWSPSGLHFAVGAFNLIALCDAAGWAYSRHRCHTGSLTCLDWTSDGTHLSGGGSNGTLLIAQLIERHKEWQQFHCRLTEKNSLAIFDLSVGGGGGGGGGRKEGEVGGGVESLVHMEELDFTSPVIDWSVSHGMLVVTTATSCQIFSAPHFSSAALIELRGGGAVELILQAERHFALVDSIKGILLYTYEGKLLQTVRLPPTVPLSSLHSSTVQLTGDLLVVASKAPPGVGGGGGVVWVLDAVQGGRKVCEPIRHSQELSLLTVCPSAGPGGQRQLAFIDRNRDLYVCALTSPTKTSTSTSTSPVPTLVPVRLSSNVDHCRWNDSYEVLAAIGEGQVRCFFLPLAPAIDPDCTPHTITHLLTSTLPPPPTSGASHTSSSSSSSSASSAIFGNRSSLSSFSLSRLTVRSSSGTVICFSVSAFPLFLHRCAAKGEWSRALRLCRLLSSSDDQRLCWAVLYGLSVQAGQLDLAQQSAAKLDWAEKVRSLQQMQSIPSEAGRRGALSAYQRQFDVAEAIFLAAQLPYRAIALHIQRCHWVKALTLARKCNCHVDTVLLARRQHLTQLKQQHSTTHSHSQQGGGGEGEVEENLEEFRAMAQVQVNADAVAAKVAAELSKEKSKGQAYPTSVRSHTQHLLDKFTGVEEERGQAGSHGQSAGSKPNGAGKWGEEEEKQQQRPNLNTWKGAEDGNRTLEL